MFLHGYNTSLTDALKLLGQLLTLGHFPPFIKPIVYSWPSGKPPPCELRQSASFNFVATAARILDGGSKGALPREQASR